MNAPHIARLLVATFVALAIAAVCGLAQAWQAAPGPATMRCDGPQREPEVRRGPQGIEYVFTPPACREVRTGRSPTYRYQDGRMIPSQQTVPDGTPCDFRRGRILLDHHVYGRTQDSVLWALFTP